MSRDQDRRKKLLRKAKKAAERRERMRHDTAVAELDWTGGSLSEGEVGDLPCAVVEIRREASAQLPREQEELMVAAYEFMNDQRGAEAERKLDEFLKLCPGNLPARFNRSVAIEMQGRERDALEIVRDIHREHPDYLFARTRLARHYIAKGRIEDANAIMEPIKRLRQMHVTEYAAICIVRIEMELAANDTDTASKVLRNWEQVDSENAMVEVMRERIRRQADPKLRLAVELFGHLARLNQWGDASR